MRNIFEKIKLALLSYLVFVILYWDKQDKRSPTEKWKEAFSPSEEQK